MGKYDAFKINKYSSTDAAPIEHTGCEPSEQIDAEIQAYWKTIHEGGGKPTPTRKRQRNKNKGKGKLGHEVYGYSVKRPRTLARDGIGGISESPGVISRTTDVNALLSLLGQQRNGPWPMQVSGAAAPSPYDLSMAASSSTTMTTRDPRTRRHMMYGAALPNQPDTSNAPLSNAFSTAANRSRGSVIDVTLTPAPPTPTTAVTCIPSVHTTITTNTSSFATSPETTVGMIQSASSSPFSTSMPMTSAPPSSTSAAAQTIPTTAPSTATSTSAVTITAATNTGASTLTAAAASAAPPTSKPVNNGDVHLFDRRHPVHWVNEGHIFLYLKGMAFRLSQNRLQKSSPFFASLFSQGKTNEEASGPDSQLPCAAKLSDVKLKAAYKWTIYDLDDVEVSLDDFVALLDIHDNVVNYTHVSPPFHIIASVLRAAATLNFPAFYRWSKQCLYDLWNSQGLLSDPTSSDVMDPARLQHAIESLVLSRRYGVDGILKRALYELVRTRATRGGSDAGSAIEQISQDDQNILFSVRGELGLAWARLAAVPPSTSECTFKDVKVVKMEMDGAASAGCVSHTPALVFQVYADVVHVSGMYEKYVLDPMAGLQALVDMEDVWMRNGICAACVEWWKGGWDEARKQLWVELDRWFGLVDS